jgi:hypothetical protein
VTDPLQYVARPRDLDKITLHDLAQSYQDHVGALVNARYNIGARGRPARLQSAALDALAIGAQVVDRMQNERWITIVEALTYGASIEKVAVALDAEPASIIEGVTRWAEGQHEHELMTDEEHARVLALLPDQSERDAR